MFTGREEAALAGKDEKLFMMKSHLNSALVNFRELCTLQLWTNFIQMFLMTIDFYLAGLPNDLGKVFFSVPGTGWSRRWWTNGCVQMIKPNCVVEPRSQA